jgi:DNA invertase Pin-like site-specific DNA recombinase
MTQYVAYARVSTAQQGRSGLGLEAQQEAIRRYVRQDDVLLTPTYIEVESGKRNDRPELEKALAHAKLTGATLLIAKLDRLARNLRFITGIMESGVEFVACDMPHANRLTLHIMGAMAEHEGAAISERTKAALKAAKERGVKLGGYRGGKTVDPSLGLAERQRKAAEFAERVRPAIAEARQAGAESLRQIAAHLTQRGVQTRRGGPWDAAKVRQLIG